MDSHHLIALALGIALTAAGGAVAQQPAEEPDGGPAPEPTGTPAAAAPAEAGREVFFEALDLQQAGDWEAAATLFRRTLQLDPELHQARIRLAECYYNLDDKLAALEQLELYLAADFPGAEVGRARLLVVACGADPDALMGRPDPSGDGEVPRRAPRDGWSPVRLEVGPQLVHFENDIGLTAGGPLVAIRVLPLDYLELTAQARVALGPYPDQGGFVAVVDFGPGVDASIPLGPTRLVAGVVVPFLLSRYGGEVRVDAGIVAELGVRVPVGATRLVLGVQLEGGYLVTPTVGGSLRFGFQLGPMGDKP